MGKSFKDYEAKASEAQNLKELFECWYNAQKMEVAETFGNEENLSEKFYRSTANTISSHFMQFAGRKGYMSCEENNDLNSSKLPVWKYILNNAFNMDGCVGTFQIPEEGFERIFLLKEANDSKKDCIRNYPSVEFREENVNIWVKRWRENMYVRSGMLEKLRRAVGTITHNEDISRKEFTEKNAYMNVNKRGGTVTTVGYDESAVVHYARKYRRFILREIVLLAGRQAGRKEICVYVCGSQKYFERILTALDVTDNLLQEYEGICGKVAVCFRDIPHPSGRISYKKLAEKMEENE